MSRYDLSRKTLNISPVRAYYLESRLGSGTFGSVYKAKCVKGSTSEVGKYYALKLMLDNKNFQEEATVLKILSSSPDCSPYIPCLYLQYNNIPIVINTQKIYVNILVVELLQGSLYKLLEQGNLPDIVIHTGIMQLLEALVYIHSKGFAHQDIKLENILYTQNGNIMKLGDVGLACGISGIEECFNAFTVEYSAPEVIYNYYSPVQIPVEVAQRADVWSLGVSFYEMIFRRSFYSTRINSLLKSNKGDTRKKIEVMTTITPEDMNPIDSNNETLNELLRGMLVLNPERRFTSQQALQFYKDSLDKCQLFDISRRELIEKVFTTNNPLSQEFLSSKGIGDVTLLHKDSLCELYNDFLLFLEYKGETNVKPLTPKIDYDDEYYPAQMMLRVKNEFLEEVDLCESLGVYGDEDFLNGIFETLGYNSEDFSKPEKCTILNDYLKGKSELNSLNITSEIIKGIKFAAVDELLEGKLNLENLNYDGGLTRKAYTIYKNVLHIFKISENKFLDYELLRSVLSDLENQLDTNDINRWLVLSRQIFIYRSILF